MIRQFIFYAKNNRILLKYLLIGILLLWLTLYLLTNSFYTNYTNALGLLVSSIFGFITLIYFYKAKSIFYKSKDVVLFKNFDETFGAFFFGSGSLLLIIFLSSNFVTSIKKQFINLSKSELTTIEDIITSKIEISYGPKSSKSIYIMLKNYRGFRFDIDGIAFDATDSYNYLNSAKRGDTISIDVLTLEYEKKIDKSNKEKIFDRVFGNKFVNVFGFRDKNNDYLTLEDYNEKDKENGIWGILIVSGIVIYILWLVYKDFKQKR